MKLEDALQQIGDTIVRDAKRNLIRAKKRASGRLYDTMRAVVDKDNELTFDMEPHWEYVDEGVGIQGPFKTRPTKMPPLKNIKAWCRLKGIHTDFAFVIAKNIKEKGIKPTYFFTNAYDKNINELDKALDDYANTLADEYIDIEL